MARAIGRFPGIERYSGGDPATTAFTAVAMFTPDYEALAQRLQASLLEHGGQHYALYEVPAVHRSISAKGIDDPSLTKASLIRFCWERYARPVLYLDCDVVVRQAPVRISLLSRMARDFAIYNWLADECTDCYVPLTVPGVPSGRLYRFSHAIDLFDPEQLICSGCVQYWAPTVQAGALLERWLQAQLRFPNSADDQCLDFAFNNRGSDPAPAYAWLDKAYARYAWWPHIRPLIDHPQLPSASAFEAIPTGEGEARVHSHQLEVRRPPRAVPRDCVVDVVSRRLYRLRPAGPGTNAAELVEAGSVDAEFFPALGAEPDRLHPPS